MPLRPMGDDLGSAEGRWSPQSRRFRLPLIGMRPSGTLLADFK